MLRLSTERRALVADNLSNLANIAVGAMVFGPFLSDQPFSMEVIALGVAIWVCLVWCAAVVVERKG